MYSSSSSDTETECFYGGFSNGTPWPMQPLIYYTHVQPNRGKQRSRESRKRNPNCFVKAFRWYTQERYPSKRTDSTGTNDPDIKGFAIWLDEKYHEFLHENKHELTTLKQTSTLEIETNSNNFPCESSGAKKCKGLKSPRKRHQKLTNSKDKENISLRSNKSFEILLYPKHVSCTTSECCQSGNSCSFNSTITTSLGKRRPKRKSQSLTSILVEKEVCVIPFDDIKYTKVVTGNRETEIAKIIAAIVEQTPNDNITSINTDDSREKSDKTSKLNTISCQCMNENNRTLNTCCKCQAQNNMSSNKVCDCKKNNTSTVTPTPSQMQRQNVLKDKKLAYTPICRDHPHTYITAQETDLKEKKASSDLTNGTQTSDYPIHLPTTQYPLFMRIICPDKLKES